MALIAFLLDNKEGHIIPSFGLASSLKMKGHDIIYLSIVDNRQLVEEQEFMFYPIFENIYPKGYHQANKKFSEVTVANADRERLHLIEIINGALDDFLKKYSPDLFVISAFLSVEMLLLHYKYGLRPVVLTTYLRDADISLSSECLGGILDFPAELFAEISEAIEHTGASFSSLKELLHPLETFHELVLCPEILNLAPSPGTMVHHTGPTIYQKRNIGTRLNLEEIKSKRKIIYASMGSYAITYKSCAVFFGVLLDLVRKNAIPGLHLVLAVGMEFDTDILGAIPENATVARWVSQTEVLKDASLVITHGGLGTIKESIYYGVPMIVFPMGYDQERNARLVEHHQLGLKRTIDDITEARLELDILEVLHSSSIHINVQKMKRVFREKEQEQIGVRVIENLLSRVAVRQ